MSSKGNLFDDLRQAKALKIVYRENGKKTERTGPTEEMIELFNQILSDPKKHWLIIQKFY